MHSRKGRRNTSTFLKLTIFAFFVCFVAQGTFAAYASAVSYQKSDTCLFKDQGVKTAPQVSKSFEMLAHLQRAPTINLSTTSSSLIRPPSYNSIVRYDSKVPARAPPVTPF